MRGFTGVAGHRALSAGTLLIAAGGLALYQMTSLVLGPAGSRELHLSLSVPAADPDARGESWASTNVSLGTMAGPSPSAPARPASALAHRASAMPAVHPHAAPALPASPVPVTSQPPTTQPSTPTAPTDGRPDSQADTQHGHGD